MRNQLLFERNLCYGASKLKMFPLLMSFLCVNFKNHNVISLENLVTEFKTDFKMKSFSAF